MLAMVGASLAIVPTPPSRGATPRPNILLIMTDDQRWDMLENMPAVRRIFGRRGATFTNAFVAVPLCCPSRATMLTGRYTHNNGVTGNSRARTNLDAETTLPYLLKRAGYQTGIAGKYLNGWPLWKRPPYFDRWATMRNYPDHYNVPVNIQGRVSQRRRYSTHFVSNQSLEMLQRFEQRDARPWFLMVTPMAPHSPYQPALRHRYDSVPGWEPSPAVGDDNSDKPEIVRQVAARYPYDPATASSDRQRQHRMLASIDEMVQGLFRRLRRYEERNTIAVFVSDNGIFLGEHGLSGKNLPYDPAVRIPLFVRWPDRIEGGQRFDNLVSMVDLAPTLLEAARIPPPTAPPFDGRSLLTAYERDHLLIEYMSFGRVPRTWYSYRDHKRQFTVYRDEEGETDEYYDLVTDPWQLTNLLGDDQPGNDPLPVEITQLRDRLAHDAVCVGTTGDHACP